MGTVVHTHADLTADPLAKAPTLGNAGGAEAKARGRFDLVLYEDDRPLLLVEFKRETETESLIQAAYRQAREYAQGLPGIRFVLLCNGRITRLFSAEGGNLRFLDGPDLASELQHLAALAVAPVKENVVFGSDYFDTERSREQPWAVSYLVALQNFIVGQSVLGEETRQFRVVQDFGTDWGHLRNAGGKHTKGVRGLFHFYEVELANGDKDILSLTIAKYDPAASGQYTSNLMTVGLGSKSMLEMQTSSRFIRRSDGQITLSHSGQMTAVKGYRSRDALREYARSIPDLVDDKGERVVFGRIADTSSSEGVGWKQIVLGIARYAIERERVEEDFRRVAKEPRIITPGHEAPGS